MNADSLGDGGHLYGSPAIPTTFKIRLPSGSAGKAGDLSIGFFGGVIIAIGAKIITFPSLFPDFSNTVTFTGVEKAPLAIAEIQQ